MRLSFLIIFLSIPVYSALFAQVKGTFVIINEVTCSPAVFEQNSMYDDNVGAMHTDDAEWVELYNPSACLAADISCFTLGSNMVLDNNWGSFTFPPGTVIPPLGFITVGGTSLGAALDFNLSDYYDTQYLCIENKGNGSVGPEGREGGGRWFLSNANGWVGLYDENGVPVDGTYWDQVGNANIINTHASYQSDLEMDCGCDASVGMRTFDAIVNFPADKRRYMDNSVGGNESLGREYDGSPNSTFFNTATLGDCNDVCAVLHQITVTTTPETCPGDCDAQVIVTNELTTDPGRPASGLYTIEIEDASNTVVRNVWDDPATDGIPDFTGTNPTTSTLSGICPGTFNITVLDSFGCQATNSVNIIVVPPLEKEYTSSDVDCFGNNNGVINGLNISGGTSPLILTIDGQAFNLIGAGPHSASVNTLNGGVKNISLQDANGCRHDTTINIIEPPQIQLTSAFTDVTCPGLQNGQINLSAASGGTAPWTVDITSSSGYSDNFSYTPPAAISPLTNLDGGTYTISITDDNGCPYSEQITIDAPPPFSDNIISFNEWCEQENGSINVQNFSGGNGGPYSLNVTNSSGASIYNQSGISLPNLNIGNLDDETYTLTFTDQDGCTHVVNEVVPNINDVLNPPYTDGSHSIIIPNGEILSGQTIDINSTLPSEWSITDWFVDNNAVAGNVSSITHYFGERGTFPIQIDLVSDHGCTTSLNRDIVIIDELNIYIPNTFLPGDYPSEEEGNRTFFPVINRPYLIEKMEGFIYNRWGERIYTYKNKMDSWNGKVEGGIDELVPIDTYVYLFYFYDIDGNRIKRAGHVNVIR